MLRLVLLLLLGLPADLGGGGRVQVDPVLPQEMGANLGQSPVASERERASRKKNNKNKKKLHQQQAIINNN